MKFNLAIPFILAITALAFASCDRKTPAEKAGDSVEEGIENVGDAAEDAGDAVEDSLD